MSIDKHTYERPEFIDVPSHILKSLVSKERDEQLEILAGQGVHCNGHRMELGSYRGVDDCGIYEVNVSVQSGGKLSFQGDYISR